MKFKHIWIQKLEELPIGLQTECIDYKKWKKIKSSYNLEILLNNECIHVDKIFNNKKNIINCYSKNFSKKELYNYAILNKKCLYKLIKRLNKRLKCNLNSLLNKYDFCCGYKLKKLELNIFGYNDDCPICLEKPSQIIIMDCGHVICVDCVKKLYNIDQLKGTLQNLISYSIYYNKKIPKCPECRYLHPVSTVRLFNV
jgi:hypothetical protein